MGDKINAKDQKDNFSEYSQNYFSSDDQDNFHYIDRECCKKCKRLKNPDTLHFKDPWKALSLKVEKYRKS